MAATPDEHPLSNNPNPDKDDIDEISDADDTEDQYLEEEDDDDDEEEEPEPQQTLPREAQYRAYRSKLDSLVQRMSTQKVPVRVHDVLIKGNKKTKDSIIEAEVEGLKNVSSMQGLLQAAAIANARLRRLEIFDSVSITLDSGPPELPGTANVIVEVVEAKSPLTGEVGVYTKTGARSSTVEGALKYKNIFGYGDLWDGSIEYGWDQAEISAGVSLPRLKGLVTPVMARISLLSKDWLTFSSYKERSLGLSLGLVSTRYHDLAYNLAWRSLMDPSQMASRTVRSQLGHGLLSSLKYTFKIDKRNSHIRPTRGYAFVSTTQIGGLAPDHRTLRFLRQDVDVRCSLPFGFYNAALNLGISTGIIFPWGKGFLNMPSSLPERYFLGGNSSVVCSLGGPAALLGFRTRGVGPTEERRKIREESSDENSEITDRDVVGGDLAVTAFADLSFDFPSNGLKKKGIHGHLFACSGNLAKLTENEFRNFSLRDFLHSFRSSVGVGIVVPISGIRMEANYCYILKQFDFDRGKTGFQFSFSMPG